jgi:glycosyltransferase involved in cell wall biosynthesis
MSHRNGCATDLNSQPRDQALDSPPPASNHTAPKARVSVLVPVKNEAENLKRCLRALAWADEVFVVDSQSTDDTAAVAAEWGAHVVQFHFNGTYPKKKNWALESLPFRNAWVLIVDADEVVVPELADEIARCTAADEADGFYLNMKYYFLGRRIRHCGYAEAWNLRLFKHRFGRYEAMPVAQGSATGDNEAHEHVELEGKALRLVHELDHFAYPSISTWVEKHNRYASWEAEQYERFLREPVPAAIGAGKRFKRRLKKLYLRLPMRPLWRFVYAYVLRLGFLDGMPGFIFCTLLSFYDFLASAKLYERRLAAQAVGSNSFTAAHPLQGGLCAAGEDAARPSSPHSESIQEPGTQRRQTSTTVQARSQPPATAP